MGLDHQGGEARHIALVPRHPDLQPFPRPEGAGGVAVVDSDELCRRPPDKALCRRFGREFIAGHDDQRAVGKRILRRFGVRSRGRFHHAPKVDCPFPQQPATGVEVACRGEPVVPHHQRVRRQILQLLRARELARPLAPAPDRHRKLPGRLEEKELIVPHGQHRDAAILQTCQSPHLPDQLSGVGGGGARLPPSAPPLGPRPARSRARHRSSRRSRRRALAHGSPRSRSRPESRTVTPLSPAFPSVPGVGPSHPVPTAKASTVAPTAKRLRSRGHNVMTTLHNVVFTLQFSIHKASGSVPPHPDGPSSPRRIRYPSTLSTPWLSTWIVSRKSLSTQHGTKYQRQAK